MPHAQQPVTVAQRALDESFHAPHPVSCMRTQSGSESTFNTEEPNRRSLSYSP